MGVEPAMTGERRFGFRVDAQALRSDAPDEVIRSACDSSCSTRCTSSLCYPCAISDRRGGEVIRPCSGSS